MQVERRAYGTVLVVDDDSEMRKLLADFLERDGHRVLEAGNGADAVALVESEPIDVVILDKEMPRMGGFDVLSLLQERGGPPVSVIFVTAFGGPQVADEALRRGALHYVEKPFRVASIVDTVQIVLQAAR